MNHTTLLLQRLDEIGTSLAGTGRGLALLALGSVGRELDRLDEYSDLDFFAVVEPGRKQAFLDDLTWLTSIAPVAYAFRNTVDGYKLLYADGVFCEFAVFEPEELAGIPFAPGRVVWQAPGFDGAVLEAPAAPTASALDVEFQLGEALTNLYVGLGRFRRGERLSAARFVQQYAVDRVLDLATLVEPEVAAHRDQYMNERRIEQRFPRLAAHMSAFVQGYDRTPESARAILAFLDEHFDVSPAIRTAILALCDGGDPTGPASQAVVVP